MREAKPYKRYKRFRRAMHIIAVVGLPGAGKTLVSDWLTDRGYGYVRLGQLTLDLVKERGQEPGEASERPIREELRRTHGMAAYATLNFPKVDVLLAAGPVVIDGLYSWEEYIAFREKYADQFITLAVYASPATRYRRLSTRVYDKVRDPAMRHRSYSSEAARGRDYAQIENLHQGGPIAMADYTLINEGSREDLQEQLTKYESSLSEKRVRS
jgi:dephospho-CoA kinase